MSLRRTMDLEAAILTAAGVAILVILVVMAWRFADQATYELATCAVEAGGFWECLAGRGS